MRENIKGHLSKAHLYVPRHEERELHVSTHSTKEIFKKVIKEEAASVSGLDESDNSSSQSEALYDDTMDDLVHGGNAGYKMSTHSSHKRSFQPANFGEYIEFKINQFFDPTAA